MPYFKVDGVYSRDRTEKTILLENLRHVIRTIFHRLKITRPDWSTTQRVTCNIQSQCLISK